MSEKQMTSTEISEVLDFILENQLLTWEMSAGGDEGDFSVRITKNDNLLKLINLDSLNHLEDLIVELLTPKFDSSVNFNGSPFSTGSFLDSDAESIHFYYEEYWTDRRSFNIEIPEFFKSFSFLTGTLSHDNEFINYKLELPDGTTTNITELLIETELEKALDTFISGSEMYLVTFNLVNGKFNGEYDFDDSESKILKLSKADIINKFTNN